MRSVVCLASLLARSATDLDRSIWPAISLTDIASSSVAAATVCTLPEASSAALATVVAWALVSVAVDAICFDDACSWIAAAVTA